MPQGQATEHKSILLPDRRHRVINEIFDVLRDWRSSPFEHEGSCVAGLRSALCMEGHRWAIADIEATSIVGEGLRLLGAQRPEWEEGQRYYGVAAENCIWCGVEIPEEHRHQKGNYRFCSIICADRSRKFNEDEDADRRDRRGDAAYRTIARAKTTARICKSCGLPFHPQRNDAKTEFCSKKCHGQSKRTLPERECQQCGKTYRPRRASMSGHFCSPDCHLAFADGKNLSRHCDYCGRGFFAASASERFCSEIHAERAKRLPPSNPRNVIDRPLQAAE